MSGSTRGFGERVRSMGAAASETLASVARTVVPGSETPLVRLAAGTLALVGLLPLAVTRAALNGPTTLPAWASGPWYDAAATAAVAVPAVATVYLGVGAAGDWRRVGLVIAGVFGLLAAVAPAVTGPAMAAVVVGSWLAVVGSVTTTGQSTGRRQSVQNAFLPGTAVAAVLLAGLTFSLFGAAGVRPAAFRPLGTTLALVGLATTPLTVAGSAATALPDDGKRGALVAGAVAGVVAAAVAFRATAAAPFVSGATILVAWSAVGASATIVAAAVGGLTATIATGVLRRRPVPVVAGLLLFAAGVPSTISRGLGVAVAVSLLASTAIETEGDSQ